MIKFYINDNDKIELNGYLLVKGTFTRSFYGNNVSVISITNNKEYYKGLITNVYFKNSEGVFVQCTSAADFDIKSKDLFESAAGGADFVASIAAIGGEKTETPATAPTGSWSWGQLLRGILNALLSFTGSADLKSFSFEITRPANTTAYTAGDVVGDISDGVIKVISNVAKAAGKGVRIYRVRIQTNDTGLTGKKLVLNLYVGTPDVTGLADNSAFTTSYANALKRAGSVDVVMKSDTWLAGVGSNDYTIVSCNPETRDLRAILVTGQDFTPSANSTKITVVLDCELSNS